MSVVDPSPLNVTISHYYACKGMIMSLATALERKLPSQIHFYISSPNLALKLHWILPSTLPALPCPKGSSPTGFWDRCWDVCLADIIISGWPDDSKEVPHPLCSYWQHCESHTIEEGLVFYGEAVIIPPSERENVLGTLHQSHQGITKTQLFACGCVFWPGINKAIEEGVWQCETCMRFQDKNATTPLTPTPTPSHPWKMCASDIFTLDGMDYLILADSYSKVILVCNLPTSKGNSAQKSSTSSKNCCVIMAHQKSYTQIMGPQYTSAAFADCSIE